MKSQAEYEDAVHLVIGKYVFSGKITSHLEATKLFSLTDLKVLVSKGIFSRGPRGYTPVTKMFSSDFLKAEKDSFLRILKADETVSTKELLERFSKVGDVKKKSSGVFESTELLVMKHLCRRFGTEKVEACIEAQKQAQISLNMVEFESYVRRSLQRR